MDLPPSKLRRFCWEEELSSYQMFCVTQVVLPLVISNGWRTWITSDGEDSLEKYFCD